MYRTPRGEESSLSPLLSSASGPKRMQLPLSQPVTNLSRDRIAVGPLVAAGELAGVRSLGSRRWPLPPGLRLLRV